MDLAQSRLVGVPTPDHEVAHPGATYGGGDISRRDLANARLMQMGADLYRLMGLEEIPDGEIAAVVRAAGP